MHSLLKLKILFADVKKNVQRVTTVKKKDQ